MIQTIHVNGVQVDLVSPDKLTELAAACDNGACNVYAILRSLGEALDETTPSKIRDDARIKIIIGQVSFLIGESLGPSESAYAQYRALAQPATR